MAVSRAEKEAELQQLHTAFAEASNVILVDFRGLDVPAATELRRQVKGAHAQYKVVKNTLAKRALVGTAYEALAPSFEGTTAVAYSEDDPVALAKALTTFAKTAPTLQVKVAIVQGKELSAADVTDLAALPAKPVLYAQLLSVMQAPMAQLVGVLAAVPRDLVSVLSQYEKRKQGGE